MANTSKRYVECLQNNATPSYFTNTLSMMFLCKNEGKMAEKIKVRVKHGGQMEIILGKSTRFLGLEGGFRLFWGPS
jgi:hypothetical protein